MRSGSASDIWLLRSGVSCVIYFSASGFACCCSSGGAGLAGSSLASPYLAGVKIPPSSRWAPASRPHLRWGLAAPAVLALHTVPVGSDLLFPAYKRPLGLVRGKDRA